MTTKIILFLVVLVSQGFGQPELKPFFFDLDSNKVQKIFQWKYKYGDQADWAQLWYNDSSWDRFEKNIGSSENSGIRWFRAQVILEGERHDSDVLAIFFSLLTSAYEVYWDGMLVSKNGQVAEAASQEIPGKIYKIVELKHKWTEPGKHLIAVRLSSHFIDQSFEIFGTQFGYLQEFESMFMEALYVNLFEIGVIFFTALFSFAIFLGGGRHRSYLLFVIFCLVYMTYSVFEVLSYTKYFNITLISYYNAFLFIGIPLLTLFLNLFVIFNFEIPRKLVHIAVNVALILSIILILLPERSIWMLLYSIGLLCYSVYKKEPGSVAALIGISVFTFVIILYLQSGFLFVYISGEVVFLFCITLSISRQIREQKRLQEATSLRSVRLETQLLKKNIQPHFLMNTLLSIMSWIEVNPKKAKKLIQSLADEFRVINKISSKKEIPIHEEIKLCETHLELMGHRMDAQYKLVSTNLCDGETIPPMIFHTLIENGITHAYETGENGTFTLLCEKNHSTIHYKLHNDGSLLKKLSRQSDDQITDGLGMKYVKARLEESYPDKWQITYGFNSKHWEVNIYLEK